MLPSQILLNTLLYDVSEMTMPTDNVDEEMLLRPSHWDMRFIRRFMAFFGPISSIFDFATFAVMLLIFKAGPELFRTGWFVESLATQSLVVFLIRSRRVPFLHSRASMPLTLTTIAVVWPERSCRSRPWRTSWVGLAAAALFRDPRRDDGDIPCVDRDRKGRSAKPLKLPESKRA